jgi:hypothetical protein
MKKHAGDSDEARGNPEVYYDLAYTFSWNLIYAINMKLGGEILELYPPGDKYDYLNILGRNVSLNGGPIKGTTGFCKWGSLVAGWVYQCCGLRLPLIAQKIRVSPTSEAFEIVGRCVCMI